MKRIDFFVILAVITLIALVVCLIWLMAGLVSGTVEWWSPVLVVLAFAHLCFQLYHYLKAPETEKAAIEE